jgi:hypothetical protein
MSAALRMEQFSGNNKRKQVLALMALMPMPTKLKQPFTGVASRLVFGVLLLICMQFMSSTQALAWTPFERKTLYEEVELSAAEAKKVQYAAGWSTQSDTELLVEIKNNLPGPLACHGATVHLLSGTTVSKSFLPRIYVPNAASRQGAVGGVKKGQMKDFSVLCHCWKKPGDTACGNPSSK